MTAECAGSKFCPILALYSSNLMDKKNLQIIFEYLPTHAKTYKLSANRILDSSIPGILQDC